MEAKMKKVKIITIILAIVLVTLVAFGGIYLKTQNRMENKVKDYSLGREIYGGRVIEIKVSDGDEEDKIEQNPEILTEENYETVKKTIENRLKALKAEDYTISLDKQNGTIRVELSENDNTDSYAYYLTASGKVQMKEKDTDTELLSDSMIKKAKYGYKTNSEGKYQIYLELQLNKDGQAKIEEISKDYAILSNEIDEIEEEQNKENAEETDTENQENIDEANVENQENTENVETTENKDEISTEKKIAVLTIADSEYDISKIDKNILTVNIGGETSNETSINNNSAKAAELAMLTNAGKYPIEYEIEANRFVYSDITEKELLYFSNKS